MPSINAFKAAAKAVVAFFEARIKHSPVSSLIMEEWVVGILSILGTVYLAVELKTSQDWLDDNVPTDTRVLKIILDGISLCQVTFWSVFFVGVPIASRTAFAYVGISSKSVYEAGVIYASRYKSYNWLISILPPVSLFVGFLIFFVGRNFIGISHSTVATALIIFVHGGFALFSVMTIKAIWGIFFGIMWGIFFGFPWIFRWIKSKIPPNN